MNTHLHIAGRKTPYHHIILTTHHHHATLSLALERAIQKGDSVTFDLDTHRLFTGSITHATTNRAITHALAHNDSYALFKPMTHPDGLANITITELIEYIVRDTPITKKHISAPKIDLPHFSWPNHTRRTALLDSIVRILQTENPDARYRYFCDNNGAFRFGTHADTGAQPPLVKTIQTTDVIQHEPKHRQLKTLPLPIVNYQTITLENKLRSVISTELVISPEDSYARIHYAN